MELFRFIQFFFLFIYSNFNYQYNVENVKAAALAMQDNACGETSTISFILEQTHIHTFIK